MSTQLFPFFDTSISEFGAECRWRLALFIRVAGFFLVYKLTISKF